MSEQGMGKRGYFGARSNSPRACCHMPDFSHALTTVLIVISSQSAFLLAMSSAAHARHHAPSTRCSRSLDRWIELIAALRPWPHATCNSLPGTANSNCHSRAERRVGRGLQNAWIAGGRMYRNCSIQDTREISSEAAKLHSM